MFKILILRISISSFKASTENRHSFNLQGGGSSCYDFISNIPGRGSRLRRLSRGREDMDRTAVSGGGIAKIFDIQV